jgi:hypothetical protein
MIYAATPQEIAARSKAFVRKWRLRDIAMRHRAVADSREETTSLPGSITLRCWRSRREFPPVFRTAPSGSSMSPTSPPFDAGALAQHGLSRFGLLDRHRLPPSPRAQR